MNNRQNPITHITQHNSTVNLIPVFRLTFRRRLTSIVFTNVTMGCGDDIHMLNDKGGISLCDVPYSEDVRQFNADYLEVTSLAAKTCKSTSLDDAMIIGTSALPHTELDCIVNQYSGRWNNPFLAWGKYRKGLFKTTLPISLQFHHAQMDGMQACRFLNNLQHEINRLIKK